MWYINKQITYICLVIKTFELENWSEFMFFKFFLTMVICWLLNGLLFILKSFSKIELWFLSTPDRFVRPLGRLRACFEGREMKNTENEDRAAKFDPPLKRNALNLGLLCGYG